MPNSTSGRCRPDVPFGSLPLSTMGTMKPVRVAMMASSMAIIKTTGVTVNGISKWFRDW